MILGTHAQKLERFLGADTVEHLSRSMISWYGPPIAVAGVPGNVWAHRGGDFRGMAREGGFLSATEFAVAALKRRWRRATHAERHARTFNAGFASLSDLIAEGTTGKRYDFAFQKAGSPGVTGVTNSLWRLGNQPAGGASPANAPGGTAFDSTVTGAFPYPDPTSGDTLHFVSASVVATVVANTLLLYDLLYGVNKTMNSTGTESVTGVPTRYQSSTSTDPNYAGGNFLFIQVGGTVLASGSHNWTVCQYRDEAGNDNQTLPLVIGNSAAIIDRLDHPTGQWFAPLATGDVGIKDLAQMQCNAAITTGVIWFMIGHPIAWMPCPVANMACLVDGISTAFNLVRIFDDACLTFLEVVKPSATATTYTGMFTAVAG